MTKNSSQMQIEIMKPIFKCQEDERIFFTRLHQIAQVNSVLGKENSVYLTLAEDVSDNVSDATLKALEQVCHIWNSKFTVINS